MRAGDTVDVLLTRQIPGDGAETTDKMTTVILENAQVLAIDQDSNENSTDPAIGTTATLQTDLFGAQKLALGTQIGNLSLVLRNVENTLVGATGPVLPRDLGGRGIFKPSKVTRSARQVPAQAAAPQRAAAQSTPNGVVSRPAGPSMLVVRGVEGQSYEVKRHGGY